MNLRRSHKRLSAWADVRSKAIQLKDEGRVDVFLYDGAEIWAFVEGYTDTYETGIVTTLISKKITEWRCECRWHDFVWERERFRGRLCSHALAVFLTRREMDSNSNQPFFFD